MAFSRNLYAPTHGYDPGDLTRKRVGDALVRKAGSFPGDTTLTVGTGPGFLVNALARAFKRCTSVGVDPDVASLLRTRSNAAVEGVETRVRTVRAELTNLPFKNEAFPLTVSAFALHTMPKWQILDVLEEMHRVTMFGGKFLIVDADFTRVRKNQPVTLYPFTPSVLDMMRTIGFGKVQPQRLEMSQDGAMIHLVSAKRFDAEGEEYDEDDEDEDDE